MPVLRIGSRGAYVELLQLALARAGYSTGNTDGIFGDMTRSKVIAFQRANSLIPDGVAGMLTWAKLEAYIKGYTQHKVSRGETMWSIAEKHNTTLQAIRTANPTLDPLNLAVGTLLTVPFRYSLVPTDINYTYALTDNIQEGLLMRYPFIRGGQFGISTMGKSLYFLAIGNGPKQLFYNGTHHANEWITTVLLYKFAENLAKAYANDTLIGGYNARQLLSQVTLYIAPLVNPDGMDLVTGGLDNSSPFFLGAKRISNNYPEIPFTSGWKANIMGTDLNLNYPAQWETARDIKFAQGYTTPAPRDYVGTEPLSAIESKAMTAFTLARNFLLTLSYHSQGEVIYWKFADFSPEGSEQIADEFARLSGYKKELTPENSAYAGYKDWFIQTFNHPGYTIEVGKGENPLPLEQFDSIYAANIGILTYAMQAVAAM